MNGPAIITSRKQVSVNPLVAFLLSFFIPGMGQLYNGDPLRGFVFCAIRILSLIAIPLPALRGSAPSPIAPMSLAALHVATQLVSAVDALIVSLRAPSPHAPRFRTARWFTAWAAAALVAHAIAYSAAASFYTICTITTDGSPYCVPGDIMLVRRHIPGGGTPGDLLISRKGEPLRIIAIAGDSAEYESGVFTINGTGLTFGKLDDDRLRKMTEFDRGDIMTERNGTREYAIRFNREGSAGENFPSDTVPAGSVLAANDNRTGAGAVRIVSLSEVDGKAEGIAYSSRITRTGMSPWIIVPVRND